MLIDSHCHLDYDGLHDDLPGVLDRASAAGIGHMITIGTRVREFDRVLGIAEAHDAVTCTVGTHPHNADDEADIDPAEIVALSRHPKVVGIGEAGLDYVYDNASRANQHTGFRNHIAVARETGLPLVIHARGADEDVAAILRDEMGKGAFTAVLHCFTGGADLAWCGVELGLYVSFSGILTFKNSADLRDLAAALPFDRLLVETDAPFLAPVPHRGRSNEPSYVAHTAAVLAETRGVPLADVARQTTANVHRLFPKLAHAATASRAA